MHLHIWKHRRPTGVKMAISRSGLTETFQESNTTSSILKLNHDPSLRQLLCPWRSEMLFLSSQPPMADGSSKCSQVFALQACTPIPSLSSEPSSTSLIEACIYSLPSFDHGESPWNIVTVRTPRTNKHTTLMGESINDHSFGADAWRRQTSTNNVPVTCQLCLSKVVANLIVRIFAVFVVAQLNENNRPNRMIK